MIVILDGPEAAGKSTIIEELKFVLPEPIKIRAWGPVSSWMEYREPLAEDLGLVGETVIWDRSWAAEVVYNDLLHRGREVNETQLFLYLEMKVEVSGGMMVMVLTDPEVLEDRRRRRREMRDKPDLPVDPIAERARFGRYAAEHEWSVVDGAQDPREVAETIHTALRLRGMR